jgi:hypothetical protein
MDQSSALELKHKQVGWLARYYVTIEKNAKEGEEPERERARLVVSTGF